MVSQEARLHRLSRPASSTGCGVKPSAPIKKSCALDLKVIGTELVLITLISTCVLSPGARCKDLSSPKRGGLAVKETALSVEDGLD